MSNFVSTVFRVIIKVPIVVIVCYIVYNIFGFGLSYFKMLGLSYVALQTAVENNYIPPSEERTLKKYMENEMETGILQNVSFTPNTALGESSRKQYGDEIVVGVQAHYKFLWPLQPRETHKDNAAVDGAKGKNSGRYKGDKTEDELERDREKYDSAMNNIVIEYKVPGLRYYSDKDK